MIDRQRENAMHDIDEIAKNSAGNWKTLAEFSVPADTDSPNEWSMAWLIHPESTPEEHEHYATVAKEMATFGDDARWISQPHWATGTLGGFWIRVFNDGRVTPAFKRLCEIEIASFDQ